ncbi:hypothetical protein ASE06_16375 [Sphingopyxis sp. Root214]|nr:hypothetical protein ASD73_14030 [Sphingopyxis sp. Root154]KRC08030.1 hypothetical protein ASE06_16375 [Sphingopyxis sp. Root214]
MSADRSQPTSLLVEQLRILDQARQKEHIVQILCSGAEAMTNFLMGTCHFGGHPIGFLAATATTV